MNIISAQYTEGNASIIVTTSSGEMVVPNASANRHYRKLQEWVEEGNTIADYVALPTYPTRDAAIQAVNDFAQNFTESVTGPVPLDEKLSWDAKEAAAKAVIAGTATTEQQSLLDDEADLTTETTASLANTIVSKASIYRQVVSRVAGLRRVLSAQIEAETDPYNFEAILEAGKTQAAQLADSIGLSS